jgi:hypothetical protein
LNLGLVGLLMLIGMILAIFRKVRLDLLTHFEWGRFRLGFLTAVLFYNWTEASFRGLSLIWFAFYIIAMEYPNRGFARREPFLQPIGSEEKMEHSEVYV